MNTHPGGRADVPLPFLEDSRQRQLVEVTIDSLAELGYVGTTLAQIAGRAEVSPGLVAHYFGDKDGLLDAAFRTLTRRVADQVRWRLRQVGTPRGRIQAVIDANLSPEEFSQRTGTAWLAFWGQVLRVPRLKRVQAAYQRRTLSNLRAALKRLLPADEAQRLAAMIAAMIDGVWLRAALSGWREADSESARALLTQFVDGRLAAVRLARTADPPPAAGPVPRAEQLGLRGTAILPAAGEQFSSVNPATGETLGYFTVAGAADIEGAVRAAQRAQLHWDAAGGAERARVLRRAAALLRSRQTQLAELDTRSTGRPVGESLRAGSFSAAEWLEYGASLAHDAGGAYVDLGSRGFGYTHREPLGVLAAGGEPSQPLHSACRQAAPALAAGNALIFKPAELTPLTAVELERIFLEAGVAPGVFQVVHGYADTSSLLVRHPDVHWIPAAPGGKAALIVFEDAALDGAVAAAVCAGCSTADPDFDGGIRVFVHSVLMAVFLERLVAHVRAQRVGDPMDPATQVGPLASAAHLNSVLRQIERAVAEGARLLTGGRRLAGDAFDGGWFLAPTVFAGCRDTMSVVRESSVGPVVTVLAFDDEQEVIARANALRSAAAAVFTGDPTRAQRVTGRLQTDRCWINDCGAMPMELARRGAESTGLGAGNVRDGVDRYTRLKRVYVAAGGIGSPD